MPCRVASHSLLGRKFGVGMPIETEMTGPVSEALSQRIAANCANEASNLVLGFPNSPVPGAVCEEFKSTFDEVLSRAVPGSRVTKLCDKKTSNRSPTQAARAS